MVGEPEFLSDGNAELILLAHHLAPQVAEIRLNAAVMLLARREFDVPESQLLPLAGTAHHGAHAEMARELLAKARARQAVGADVAFGPAALEEGSEPPPGENR